MPPRNFQIIVLTAIVSLACYSKARHNRYAAQLADAMLVINDEYVDEVKQRSLFENAMQGMVKGLDPYSSYIKPDDYQQMEQSLDQEFGGVGIEVEKESDDSPIIILRPVFNSPAFHGGLRPGDMILSINGENTVGMKRDDWVKKMRGKPGTKVKLRIQRAGSGEELDIEIERAVIPVDSLLGDVRRDDGSWDFRMADNPRIGYLRLTSFGQHTAEELGKALGGGHGCPYDAIVLDVRNNAGGLLDSAVETCDLFIDEGRIVSTRGRDGADRTVVKADKSMIIPRTVPMVVMINRHSASASEIVAACLQDHGGAIVVGERTFGKGTVQNVYKLEGGESALKLTVATYWRPSGKNIHRREGAPENEDWGVQPDAGFSVTLTEAQMDAVFRARRDRDIGRVPGSSPIAAATAKRSGHETGPGPKGSPSSAADVDGHPVTDGSPVEPTVTASAGSAPASTSSAPPGSKEPVSADDLQLRRAVEFLTEKLENSAARQSGPISANPKQ